MVRRASFAALVTGLLILAFGAVPRTSAPIKLARHPDYHAGKIAFSYLGDIWTANEDGGDPHRLTDNRGHEVYPRFSPDGRWIAFSSNRYGNNDVFVIAAAGGAPRRLTFHTGNDDVVGWTRDSQHILFRAAQETAHFRTWRRCIRCRSAAAPSSRCPSIGATGATFRQTANRSSSTAIPRCGRASTTAEAMRRICGLPT